MNDNRFNIMEGFSGGSTDKLPSYANSIFDPDALASQYAIAGANNMNSLTQNSAFDTNAQNVLNFSGKGVGTEGSLWSDPNTWNAAAKGIGAASGLVTAYTGLENLGIAKDQLAFQKEAFWSQFNQQEEDRAASAARRKASASGVSQYS